MAFSGRESMDLQQWQADTWQGAQSHKTSPAETDKSHLYREGKAQQYEISKSALSACVFFCKMNPTDNCQHPSSGPGLQDISIFLRIDRTDDHCIILPKKLAIFLPIQQIFWMLIVFMIVF